MLVRSSNTHDRLSNNYSGHSAEDGTTVTQHLHFGLQKHDVASQIESNWGICPC